jgi:hypothetical protein
LNLPATCLWSFHKQPSFYCVDRQHYETNRLWVRMFLNTIFTK